MSLNQRIDIRQNRSEVRSYIAVTYLLFRSRVHFYDPEWMISLISVICFVCMYVCTRLFITVNIAVTLQITNNKEMKNTH